MKWILVVFLSRSGYPEVILGCTEPLGYCLEMTELSLDRML